MSAQGGDCQEVRPQPQSGGAGSWEQSQHYFFPDCSGPEGSVSHELHKELLSPSRLGMYFMKAVDMFSIS